jgi:hypothetical protein
VAAHNHHGAKGSFPLGLEMMPGLDYTRATCFVRLLPFMEESKLYATWNFTKPASNVSTNLATSRAASSMPNLICPSDRFKENPFQLTGAVEAFPSTSSCGAVPGWYSATSYAGNYGEGSYYTRFSQFPIRPNGIYFLTGRDPQLASPGGGLHALCDNHLNLAPVNVRDIIDGASKTLMMGEKYHQDEFFDTWTADNSGLRMYQVSAWAWSGGMKGPAHVCCSSAVGINYGVRFYTSSPNDIGAQDRRFNGWGSGHPGGACFLLCDGAVRFVGDTLDQITLIRLSTRAGREPVSETSY